MTDKTKKILKIASRASIAAGTIGFVLLGGAEAGAVAIASFSVAALGGVSAMIAAIIG